MNPQVALLILRLIDIVAAGVALAPQMAARRDRYSRLLQTLVEEGRDPSPAEIDALLEESEELTEKIRALAAQKAAGR